MIRRALLLAFVAFPVAAQTLPKRQLVEEVRLDATTEDFPDVWTVLVSRRGEIDVVVGKDQQIRFYNAAGKKLGTFGGVGSGPGEFRRAAWFGWTGDTLWAYDVDQRRVTYISPDHKLLRSEVLSQSLNMATSQAPGALGAGVIMQFTPRAIVGGKYVGNAIIAGGKTADGRQDSRLRTMVLSRGDSAGAGPHKFLSDQPTSDDNMLRWEAADGGSPAAMLVPFTFPPSVVYSTDGGRIGFLTVEPSETGGTYTVKVMKTSGEPVFTRAYPYVGVPIPRSLADSIVGRVGIGSNNQPLFHPSAIAKFRDEVKRRMPKFYPAVTALHLNRDNTAWIQMRRLTAESAAAVVLIDERGNQVATFDLPPRTRIMQATRDQIWTVVTDDDDLPSVVRYRIR